jgi:threonyl-tRNA synthetase
MVHRAILGSYERFMALVIEHFAGAFPFWMAPIQIRVIPISDKHKEYAQNIKKELADFRVDIDAGNETMGKKIRNGELQKIPYLLVVGDKEIEQNSIAARERGKKDIETIKIDEFVKKVKIKLENKI